MKNLGIFLAGFASGWVVRSTVDSSRSLAVSGVSAVFGTVDRVRRVLAMEKAMDDEGFGHCTNEYECEAACPKEIKISNIARLNREYLRATLVSE